VALWLGESRVQSHEQVRAAEWEVRMQPVEELFQAYKIRHTECVNSKVLPRKYLVVRMEDRDAGIGNQLPSVISGTGRILCLTLRGCKRHCDSAAGKHGRASQGLQLTLAIAAEHDGRWCL
jgi:hypothetical protein